MRSGWLLRDGDVVCALEMAESSAERRSGLRGREGWTARCISKAVRTVHTLGVGFPVDVAFSRPTSRSCGSPSLKPWRMALGGPSARSVVAAQAGSFERWGVREGDQLEVREAK